MRDNKGHFLIGDDTNVTHGMRHTRIYRTWSHLVERCNNSKCERYKNYGARGIRCEWSSFDEFAKDMYGSYLEHVESFGERNTTIDRVDNDGNYSKSNCRWATPAKQRRNKTNNRWIIFNGERRILSEWAEIYGLNVKVLFSRIKIGWDIEKALTAKLRVR